MYRKFLSYTSIVLFLATFFSSCSKKVLEETPLSFYSVSNSYVTASDFQTALTQMYSDTRYQYECNVGNKHDYLLGTDLCINAITDNWPLNTYVALTPSAGFSSAIWNYDYKLIFNANVIITEIEKNITIDTVTRNELKAEALFFRAFGYRNLADIFGGVPLVLKEINAPARNYVRSTRDSVFQQCAADLEFASKNLYDVPGAKDGQVNQATAYHLLSEIYISLRRWDDAITAASAAINNPAVGLMTNRFGTKASQPGDVISDLFRNGNYNKSEGNTEGLWVIQWSYNNLGSPQPGDQLGWYTTPLYVNVVLDDGVAAFPAPNQALDGFGIGWLKPTWQTLQSVWQSDFNNDIRNSQYNIIRDAKVLNPASKYYGQYVGANHLIQPYDTSRNWYPIFTKTARWNDAQSQDLVNAATGEVNYNSSTNKDFYMFRLAETYLLRAEAYLGKSDNIDAAKDINTLRTRAHASPVAPGDVTIDYILDERLRELPFEEMRLTTLTRLGLLADRCRKYNPLAGKDIKDYQNLYPIPFSEIENNTEAVLTQNPGYN
jgi:hypothetical protein